MGKKKAINMTEGGIVKPLIFFILPLIGSSIFQQLYNTADFLFVGNFLGTTAAAAVGASSTLITVTIGLFSGISVGTNVITAQAIGEKDEKKANRVLHSSVTFAIVGGLILAVLGIIFAPPILRLLNTPETVMEQAVLYIRIYFLSMPMSILYNMGSGALRACGDSQTPFRIQVICGFVNVIGDALLIVVLPWGVAGVAIATVFAQGLAAVLTLYHLQKPERPVCFSVQQLGIDGELMKQVLRIGLPAGFQSMMITFSNIVIQYHINGFGEVAVAAFATYYKVENFIYLPIMAFGQASTTFTGQNKGAKQYKRIRKGTVTIAGFGAAVVFCIAMVILTFPDIVFGWFMKDKEVVINALKIACVSFPFYWIYPIMEVTSGSVKGMGYSFSSMMIILLNISGLRIILLSVFARINPTLEALASVYPITWATATICFVILFAVIIQKKCAEEHHK